MFFARLVIVVVGVPLPYLARLPGIHKYGSEWLTDYFGEPPIMGILFTQTFNVFCWGSVFAVTYLFRSARTVYVPLVLGFGYCFWLHSQLDLASDAQAGVGLAVFPVVAMVPVAIGAFLGWALEKWLWRANTLF